MKRSVLSALLVSSFGLGLLAGQVLPSAQADVRSADTRRDDILLESDRAYFELSIFADALHNIRTQHLNPPSVSALIAHAIEGMTDALDPYSEYLNEDRRKILEEDSQGEYEGIGVMLERSDDGPRIQRVMPDSPAARQGLRAGDLLLRVGDIDVTNATMGALIEHIRGGDTKRLMLRIQRGEDILDVEIAREVIHVAPLSATTLPTGALWLQLRMFDAQTHRNVRDALKQHARSEHANAGVILDLRNNPGGLFTEAISVARLFLSKGAIVSVDDGLQSGRHTWEAEAKQMRYDGQLVVLIDEYSASGAEIVAAALQENARAQVIGERSFGKGTVQRLFKLADGSALKLTVSAYYSPKDHCIDGHGVVPDLRPSPPSKAGSDAVPPTQMNASTDPAGSKDLTTADPNPTQDDTTPYRSDSHAVQLCRGHVQNTRTPDLRVPTPDRRFDQDPALALAAQTLLRTARSK